MVLLETLWSWKPKTIPQQPATITSLKEFKAPHSHSILAVTYGFFKKTMFSNERSDGTMNEGWTTKKHQRTILNLFLDKGNSLTLVTPSDFCFESRVTTTTLPLAMT